MSNETTTALVARDAARTALDAARRKAEEAGKDLASCQRRLDRRSADVLLAEKAFETADAAFLKANGSPVPAKK
jgi:hypothetical protein